MDPIGWFIASLHQLIGHDKTAAVINEPPGDKSQCVMCIYEADPTNANQDAVIKAIGRAQQAA